MYTEYINNHNMFKMRYHITTFTKLFENMSISLKYHKN